MPRLIDADALRDTLERYLHAPHVQVGNSIGQGMRIAIKACIELLDNERTIDPESLRPHGRWIGLEYDGYADGCPVYDLWECSNCGEEERGEDVPEQNPYCRSCGAKMDEEGT